MGCTNSKGGAVSAPTAVLNDTKSKLEVLPTSEPIQQSKPVPLIPPVEIIKPVITIEKTPATKTEVKEQSTPPIPKVELSVEEIFLELLGNNNTTDTVKYDTILNSAQIQQFLADETLLLANLRGLFEIVDEDSDEQINLKEFKELWDLLSISIKETKRISSIRPSPVNNTVNNNQNNPSNTSSRSLPTPPSLQISTTSSNNTPLSILTDDSSSSTATSPISTTTTTDTIDRPQSTRRPPSKRIVHSPSPNLNKNASLPSPLPTITDSQNESEENIDTKNTTNNDENNTNTVTEGVAASLQDPNASRAVVKGRRAPTRKAPTTPSFNAGSDPTTLSNPFEHTHVSEKNKQEQHLSGSSTTSQRSLADILNANNTTSRGASWDKYAHSSSVYDNSASLTISTAGDDSLDLMDDTSLVPRPHQKKGFMRIEEGTDSPNSPMSPNTPTNNTTNNTTTSNFNTSLPMNTNTTSNSTSKPSSPRLNVVTTSNTNKHFYVLDSGELKYLDHASKSYKTIGLSNVKIEVIGDTIDIISTEEAAMSERDGGEKESSPRPPFSTSTSQEINTNNEQSNNNNGNLTAGSAVTSPRNRRVSLKLRNEQDANEWRNAIDEHIQYNAVCEAIKGTNTPKSIPKDTKK